MDDCCGNVCSFAPEAFVDLIVEPRSWCMDARVCLARRDLTRGENGGSTLSVNSLLNTVYRAAISALWIQLSVGVPRNVSAYQEF